MPDQPLHLLLDQNIPEEIARWLRVNFPAWRITHVKDVKLDGRPDPEIFRWAQTNFAIVVSYDEDFADTRSFPLGTHHGIVRLRVWPTTVEETQAALDRLLTQVPLADLRGSLIIIDREKIRLRRKP
jgi:predicted nuclease of predicted toxin-antitoxin system